MAKLSPFEHNIMHRHATALLQGNDSDYTDGLVDAMVAMGVQCAEVGIPLPQINSLIKEAMTECVNAIVNDY